MGDLLQPMTLTMYPCAHMRSTLRNWLLLLALALPLPCAAYQAAMVRTIQVLVPPGQDLFEAWERVRADEGRMLDEAMVEKHLSSLGELGWVEAVDVDIRPASSNPYFDLIYRLIPRGLVREVRIEGAEALDPRRLEEVVTSQEGRVFDLRQAMDDAHEINMAYQDAGFALSGVLDSENILFENGVLTFRVAEAHLEEPQRRQLEQQLGDRVPAGPLRRTEISSLLAEADLSGHFRLPETRVRVDRRSGSLRFDHRRN